MIKLLTHPMAKKQSADLSQFVTVREAAKQVGVSPRWIRKMIEQGQIEGVRVNPRVWLVRVQSLNEFQRRRES